MFAIELKQIENNIIPIYEKEGGEQLINARELFYALRGKETKTKFADWIKERLIKYQFVENADYICFRNFTKAEKYGNKTTIEYYLTIDTSKEILFSIRYSRTTWGFSENNLPHSNFIGAIARQLGMKISYKHYYEDDDMAIVPYISKGNDYYQVYYKPKAVEKIVKWFQTNKQAIEYKIIYQRNTKNGQKGEIKEQGFKIDNVCYKIIDKND